MAGYGKKEPESPDQELNQDLQLTWLSLYCWAIRIIAPSFAEEC